MCLAKKSPKKSEKRKVRNRLKTFYVSVITAIKPQKNKKRVNIYLNGKFAFGLDLINFVKLGLKVEQNLSEEKIEQILEKAEYQKIYNKLLRFATLRPRSTQEIKNWFKKHKVNERLHKKMFNGLTRLDLLDDKKFAQWWVEQRQNFRPKAKRILSQELWIKGISRNIIEDVLAEFEIDEAKIAKNILMKKEYKWNKLPKLEKRKKMGEFLARKGFGWDVIREVVK